MSRELVSFDYAMKYILRQKTNFDILEGFLEALLKEEITIIDILESESNKDRDESKLSRVDLMAKDSNDRRLIIEIQYDREDDYLERILWESSKVITDSLDKSQPYKNVVKVISISILYFNLGYGEYCTYKGCVEFKSLNEEQKGLKLKRNVFPEYYLINVDRFKDVINSDLDEWIYMFRHSEVPENPKAKHMDKVQDKLDVLKMTKQEKIAYETFIRNKKIEQSIKDSAMRESFDKGIAVGEARGIAVGEERGIAIGEARGRVEGKEEGIAIGEARGANEEKRRMAISLLDLLGNGDIANTTGLSLKEVQQLRRDAKNN
ncbi:MAG: hypothetical protein ATN35_03445 [Epulopiscium sp. Nele67-Bin004]|nr:MAG: hypothetical protein ATN35_03445 [Epulopiscium sp. Nele67-Bin004]